jgi:transcription initiation factor TFIIIB Brf1 subunit/transcription initiation factor TFIIB
MSLKFKRCEGCRQKIGDGSNFIHDRMTASIICTLCGVVQRNNGFHETIKDNRYFEEQGVAQGFTRTSQRMYHMTNVCCQKELKKDRVQRQLIKMSDQLDVIERVRDRAWLLFLRNECFFNIRPLTNVIGSALIIASHTLQIHLSLDTVQSLFRLKNLSSTHKDLCKKLRLNLRTTPELLIPLWVSKLGGKYSDNEHVKRLYKQLSRKYRSIGSETLLAGSLLKFYKTKTEQEISDATGVSVTSLKVFSS